MTFHGWNEEQAQALCDSIKFGGSNPPWKPEHLQKLHDWCSAHGKNPNTTEGQIDFIAYELRNCFEGIGRALDRAQNKQAAIEAIEPYVRLLLDNARKGHSCEASRLQARPLASGPVP